jgi:hypothetical protein
LQRVLADRPVPLRQRAALPLQFLAQASPSFKAHQFYLALGASELNSKLDMQLSKSPPR